ncbi:MAG: branched-chain-amino-acid transaminase [Candidatus Hydrogenedentota bacterium]|nr:MAG: branched-chain-amino-acid transaminase [Candidatus Hydrogenedentota bacterium]
MARQVYIDGEFLPEEDAKISIFDHGFLYGDGVFEGIRSYEGLVFCLDEHIDRLYKSARAIALEVPIPRDEFADVIVETLRRNSLLSGYVRPIVTRGCGDLGLDPRKCPKPSVIVAADKLTLYPEEFYRDGLEVTFVSTRRNIPDALPPQVKSLNYLNNILGRLEVNRMGVGEGIMLNALGFIAEATADNVFIVKEGVLKTPTTSSGALPGITRSCVLELAREEGIPVEETELTPYDLYAADECFLTGTGAEVVPVRAVEGRPVGTGRPGPMTRKLIEKFRNLTKSRGRRYEL